MRQCMDSENLHRRLKKIIGQVQAIDRMIDEDIPCEDILSQINAAKSALHKVRTGRSGRAHQPLCPRRHRARRCRSDHRQLHQGRRAICKHDLTKISQTAAQCSCFFFFPLTNRYPHRYTDNRIYQYPYRYYRGGICHAKTGTAARVGRHQTGHRFSDSFRPGPAAEHLCT